MKIAPYLRIDFTYPHSVTVEDVRFCQPYKGCVIEDTDIFDAKCLLKRNIHGITGCFRMEVQFLKCAKLEGVANDSRNVGIPEISPVEI